MKIIIAYDKYLLAYYQKNSPLPYCWFCDHSPYKAEMRDDGLIYLSGHKTREDAEKHPPY